MTQREVPRITVALVTPFTPSGGIDEEGLKRQAVWVAAQGVQAVIPAGTTGEFAERLLVLEVTREAMPDAFIFANVSACSVGDALELARQAISSSTAKPDGLLVLPPFYHRPFTPEQGERGVEDFYRAFLDGLPGMGGAGGVPGVFFYTFALHTQQPITPACYGRLASAYPSLVRGIKASYVGIEEASALAAAAPGTVVAVGNGRIQLESLRRGLHVVSGDCLPICWALTQLLRLSERASSGDGPGAERAATMAEGAQRALVEAWRGEMDRHDEVPALKCALAMIPEVATPEACRPPLVTMSPGGKGGAGISGAMDAVRAAFAKLE